MVDGRRSSLTATLHSAYVQLILAGARRIGLDCDAVLTAADLVPSQIADLKTRVPLEGTRRLWAQLVKVTGDDAVGLRLARAAQTASAGPVEYAARNCPTVGEVLSTGAQYAQLLNTGALIEVDSRPTQVAMIYRLLERHDVHHAATDFLLAYLLHRTQAISGRTLAPAEVQLTQARPNDTGPYTAVFGPHIRWGCPLMKVCFSPAQWATPVVDPDSELARVMREVVEQQLAALPRIDDICAQIKVELLRSSEGSAPSLAEMARRLGQSARSVQRRLSEAGTTYRELSIQVRMAFAADLLRAGHLPLAEVAFVVGFSEPSPFHRAFRRTYGVTPTQYRTDAHAS